MTTLLYGAKVLQDGGFVRRDLVIREGRFHIPLSSEPIDSAAIELNLTDYYIVPGLLDVHVHLREPGFSYKETIASGTRAAARGGFTGVCAMPNLNPMPDCEDGLAAQEQIIARDAIIDVYPYACITRGELGRELVDIEALAKRVIGFSDDGKGVQDDGMMREAMARVREADSRIAAHCEDESPLNGGWIHDGGYARAHGHRGISSASEWRQVERDLELVRDTRCSYHVCHISTKESVALIRAAKRDRLPVTCETAPHYLLLCDDDLHDSGDFKMNPPIRSSADRDALLEGLLDGTVDMIATDHAPHAAHEKSGGLKNALSGIVGLETAFRVLHTVLVRRNILPLEFLIEKMAVAPRRVFGLERPIADGGIADLAVIDPHTCEAIDPARFLSMGHSTPFSGMETTGDIALTMRRGEIVWARKDYRKGADKP